jgi:hypothetical protein
MGRPGRRGTEIPLYNGDFVASGPSSRNNERRPCPIKGGAGLFAFRVGYGRRLAKRAAAERTRRTPQRAQARARKGAAAKAKDWAPAWLDAFCETGMVSAACDAAGVGRSTVYQRRQRDEAFSVAWADAAERAIEIMEAEAFRRAVEGVERPVTVAGEREIVREYRDRLLMFLLRARRPETYRENVQVDHAGEVAHAHQVDLELSDATRERVLRLLRDDQDDE